MRDSAPEYSIESQIKIVYAVCALHNFIAWVGLEPTIPEDDLVLDPDEDNIEGFNRRLESFVFSYGLPPDLQGTDGTLFNLPVNDSGNVVMDQLRDNIAKGMWEDYQVYSK